MGLWRIDPILETLKAMRRSGDRQAQHPDREISEKGSELGWAAENAIRDYKRNRRR